ncbi:hypothetical protein ATW55_08170 [Ferroacidibacillus organovorans]|uniref:Gcp-like domain-containing protein n=1 Tax=Ferroacidibacillus organovorans TaxID=1765683 RepID=A0A101XSL1_9BACL|nr:hypothetical protein ATW55_08170 [Ferroacidibacillus organovorans]
MSNADLFVGLDTSNYTTSLCAVSACGEIVFEKRLLLEVPKGARGFASLRRCFSMSSVCLHF